MYKEHPEFKLPPSEAHIWRFMDFTKFVSLIDRSALFFCRSDLLEDPFEGHYPPAQIRIKQEEMEKRGAPRAAIECIDERQGLQGLFKKIVYINAWHINQHESAATTPTPNI